MTQGRAFADRGVGNRSGGSREAVKATATRRLAAILAADVAGYSRLMGTDEEGTHERLKAHLGEVVEPKIREHRGRIVNTTGDGVLAEFASVVDGVHCAGEIQRAMADRDLDLAEERRLRFRIGVGEALACAAGFPVLEEEVATGQNHQAMQAMMSTAAATVAGRARLRRDGRAGSLGTGGNATPSGRSA